MKISEETFLENMRKKYKNKYTAMSHYINSTKKIKIKCNSCGYIFEIEPNYLFKKYHKCPNCEKNYPKCKLTNEELIDIIKNKYLELGEAPKSSILFDTNLPSYDVYKKRFKSWKAVLKLAGIEKKKQEKPKVKKYVMSKEETRKTKSKKICYVQRRI